MLHGIVSIPVERRAVALALFTVLTGSSASLAGAGQPRPDESTKATKATPVELETPLPNPYMGWGLWAGPRQYGYNEKSFTVAENTTGFGDDAPLFNWLLIDWDWASIEPTEEQRNWKDFDAVVDYWKARHKQFVVRFWVTDDAGWNGHPGVPVLPDWIWGKGLRYDEYKGNGGVMQREPLYADPSFKNIYLPELRKFLQDFARRYDQPGTPIVLLQVMGYGHWADWATWYSHYKFPSVKVKHEILADIMQVYIQTFKHIQLMEMGDWDWNASEFATIEDHLYNKALDVALEHHFGLIWTGFIDGLGHWDRDIMEEYWRQHPIVAEGNWNYDDLVDQKVHGTFAENLDVGLTWHANYTHFYFGSPVYKRAMREQPDVIRRGLKQGGLGYRLAPLSLSWPGSLPAGDLLVFKQDWVNRNVGRLYVRHLLKLYLTDAQGNEKFSEVDTSFDETQWVQGKDYPLISVFHLPRNLTPGMYDVRIALADVNAGKPEIKLGIEGLDPQGRYKVGEIRIEPYNGPPGCVTDPCP
jgi:uncharacterized protein DUF4832